MRKLRKFVIVSGALLLSSMGFVSCSDEMDKMDDKTMGASFIQVITASTTSVSLQWSITPTSKVEGYKVEIYQGTRNNIGSLVTSGTFDNKTYASTFSGLTPDTHYVVATQCIPASGSGFNKADVAYFEFWTAPILTLTSASASNVKQMTYEDGNPKTDADGNPLYQANVTVNWAENLTVQQVNNITIYIAYIDENGEEIQVYNANTPALNYENPNASLGTSYTVTVENVVLGGNYVADIFPNPSEYSWFTTATVSWSNEVSFVMPTVQ